MRATWQREQNNQTNSRLPVSLFCRCNPSDFLIRDNLVGVAILREKSQRPSNATAS
jgi:hypothetical protein